MRSIAVLLLAFALALFPLSGTRAMAAVAAHGPAHVHTHEHGHGPASADRHHHHHGADLHDRGASAPPGAISDVGHHAPSSNPCGGDQASAACCSLSCHAMAAAVGLPVKVRSMAVSRLEPVALPMPTGIRFDGLLRPPRPT